MVLPKALEGISQPILHHRSKAFIELFGEIRQGLKDLFETQNEVLVLASSGTGAMESAVCNLCSPGDEVLTVSAGKFGERWGEICDAYGLKRKTLEVEWGSAPTSKQIQTFLSENPNAKVLFLQACETSTCVNFPIEEIAKLTRTSNTLLVVDAVSFLGVSPLSMDRWGIDVVVSGSQKGLMLPPGLGLIAMNDRAWALQKKSKLPKYYFDLGKELKAQQKNQTAYTASVSLMVGLKAVLDFFKQESKEKIFLKHQKMASAMREAVTAMDLELFSKSPSDGLVAIRVPNGIDGEKIVAQLRDQYHMTIIGGQDKLKGKIIRIGCMGYLDVFDVIAVFSALEKVLVSLGAKISLGKGVRVLQEKLLGALL